jgi:tetratricopeptide (TPR) repeat protein
MPPIPPRLLQLAPADRLQLETWLAEFEENWDEHRLTIQVERLPPPGHPLRLPALIELVKIDLERQWQHGRRLRVADYLQRYPELGPAAAPSDLLLAEGELVGQSSPEVLTVRATQVTPTVRPDAPHAPAGAPHVPGYKIVGELGKGGMGAVFRGHDATLDRDVAVKVLLNRHRGHSDAERRFLREARICGQLQHPGVVPVYGLGRADDARPVFIMKVVEGRTLAALLGERKSPADGLSHFLGIFEQVCQAVAYAHSKRVIHRDLKPANVMVGAFGEVQVMDWGLAKMLHGGSANAGRQLPAEGSPEQGADAPRSPLGSTLDEFGATGAVGTPQYMPPEQALGHSADADERADVFGLGAILCDILTGEPPFTDGATVKALAKAALGQLGEAFSRLESCGSDAELIALCKECLARQAEDRPRDGSVVAARAAAYRAGVQERLRAAELERAAAVARAAEAKATAAAERKARWRTLALAIAVLLLVISAAAMALTQQRRREKADEGLGASLRYARRLRIAANAATTLADLGKFDTALDVVRSAQERARDNDASDETRQEADSLIQQLAEEVREAQRDRDLLRALLEVRGPQQGPLTSRGEGLSMAVQVGPTADERFAAALRDWDETFDVDAPTDTVVTRLKARPPVVRTEVIAALAEWAAERQQRGKPAPNWKKLTDELAEQLPGRSGDAALLEQVRALHRQGDDRRAESLLREAIRARPQEVLLYNALGKLLEDQQPPRWVDAVECYRAAQALRPEWGEPLAFALVQCGRADEGFALYADLIEARPNDPWLYSRRGSARYDRRDYAGAEQDYKEASRRKPRDVFLAHNSLGNSLFAQGRFDQAQQAYQEALAGSADLAEARANLGAAFFEQGQYAEAAEECGKAIGSRPAFAPAHNNRGAALLLLNRPDDAVAEFRQAIDLMPNFALAHANLAHVLERRGLREAAEQECRAAIRLQPDLSLAYNVLGTTLFYMGQSRHREAETAFREAIRLRPLLAPAYGGLAAVLQEHGRNEEAEQACRTAIELQPDLAVAHFFLACALHDQGQFDEALRALRQAKQLGFPPRDNLLRDYERHSQLDRRLPHVFSGAEQPRSAAEQLEFAKICHCKGFRVAATRLTVDAFMREPNLADDLGSFYRYNGACSAVLAAAGNAVDTGLPPDKVKQMLRRQALDWLRADLLQCVASRAANARGWEGRPWLSDPELASVRDDQALLRLPDDELLAWRKLWRDVATLLQ